MTILRIAKKIINNNYFFAIYVVASTLTLVASSGHTINNKAYNSCMFYYKKVCNNKIINSPERICKLSLVHNISYKKYKLSGIKKICKSQK